MAAANFPKVSRYQAAMAAGGEGATTRNNDLNEVTHRYYRVVIEDITVKSIASREASAEAVPPTPRTDARAK
jgi:hypothetical protein